MFRNLILFLSRLNIFQTLTDQLKSTLVLVSHDESLQDYVDIGYRLSQGKFALCFERNDKYPRVQV